MSKPTIGVLALQGAFSKHIEMLKQLGVNTCEVRRPEELKGCDGLIIPGGESTTMMKQINFIALREALQEFGKQKPMFGTCAGLILMSKHIKADQMKPFGFIDIEVERNAFGRQADSFVQEIELVLETKKSQKFPALFIRAPRIRECGPDVKVLAKFEDEAILVRQGHHMAATFHPELTSDGAIHSYFIKMLKG